MKRIIKNSVTSSKSTDAQREYEYRKNIYLKRKHEFETLGEDDNNDVLSREEKMRIAKAEMDKVNPKSVKSAKDATSKNDKRLSPTSERYKGYLIVLDRGGDGYNVYDKHRELEDAGYPSIDAAKNFIDELVANDDVYSAHSAEKVDWYELDWDEQIELIKKYIRKYKGTRIFEDFAEYIDEPVEDIIDAFSDAESRGDLRIPERMQLDSEYRNDDIYSSTTSSNRYWYFTRHGVQPGSVPKYVNILDIVDKPEGSYFLADGVILTKDLRDYDIKERKPEDSVTSSTRIEYSDYKSDRRIGVTNQRYKGYMIRLDRAGYGYNVYDKNGELEDSGYPSKEAARNFIDELVSEADDEIESSVDIDEETEDPKWICLDIKHVRDSDGMLTDYALYTTEDEDKYICMFGDVDAYPPDEMYADAEFDSEEEALEWFEDYTGPGDEDEDEDYDVYHDVIDASEELDEDVTVEFDMDRVRIDVDKSGSWEYMDDSFLNDVMTDNDTLYSEEYDVKVRDRNGLLEDLDDILKYDIPVEEGEYRISCHITLVYHITGIEKYDEYPDDNYGDSFEYSTENAEVKFDFHDSYVEDFRIVD